MLCNFLTNNILGREGLLCPNGIKVKRFKHLMLLRLPSGHSRHAASSCSSSRWQSTYTAVITKLHLSNSVASWRYWRVYIKQENMERSMKLEDGLLIKWNSNTEQRSFSLTRGNPNIRSSHKQLSFSSSLTSGCISVSSLWVAPDPVPVRPTGRSVTRHSEVTAPSGWSSNVRGKRSDEGRIRECEGQGWGYGPWHPATLLSLPTHLKLSKHLLNTGCWSKAGHQVMTTSSDPMLKI